MQLVSIVIPIYNMGDKIKSCLESILNQTYSNIEVILVDDGSTDNSFSVCKNLMESDDRILVVHTANQGSGPARNEGIERASGRYIYFPDADDLIEKNTISYLVERMEESCVDLIVFGFRRIAPNGNLIDEKKYESKFFSGKEIRTSYSEFYHQNGTWTIQGAPWNKFFDLDIIRKYHIRYPSLRRHQDEGFIARYVNVLNNVLFVNEVFYSYFVNDLAKQWDKYPITYFENINQLFDERKTNLLVWNEQDTKTHELVYIEYIYNVIKSLELSFSPKYKIQDKIAWMKEKAKFIDFTVGVNSLKLHIYQAIVWYLLKAKLYRLAFTTMKMKVSFEKKYR